MIIDNIYYVNAKFKHKKKVICLNGIVYKHNAKQEYKRIRILKKYKITESVILYDIQIIKELGKSII